MTKGNPRSHGAVAQLGERRVRNAKAEGSIPFRSTFMVNIFWIGLAGGIGSIARYLVGLFAVRYLGVSLFYGTFTVNLVGSFIMGLVMSLSLHHPSMPPHLRLVLTVGFLGGFTTYSSFNQETLVELQTGNYQKAFLYICMTLVLCLAAGSIGFGIGRKVSGFPY